MMAYDPLVLNPADLRHIVQIQAVSEMRDDYGQATNEWSTVLTIRAKIEGVTSGTYKNLISNGVITNETSSIITMRYPGKKYVIEPEMRVVNNDDVYLIQAIDNVQMNNRVLKLMVMRIDGDSN